MKIFIWLLCLVLALLWGGLALLSVEAAQWLAGGLASGRLDNLASSAAQWPVPTWLPAWIDPAWAQTLQRALAGALKTMATESPRLSTLFTSLVPVIWIVWGMGLFTLVAITGIAHWFIGWLRRRNAVSATAD